MEPKMQMSGRSKNLLDWHNIVSTTDMVEPTQPACQAAAKPTDLRKPHKMSQAMNLLELRLSLFYAQRHLPA